MLRKYIEQNSLLRELKYQIIRPLHQLTVPKSALETAERDIKLVLSCPDFQKIPKVKDAGKIKRGKLVMHNGSKILPGSYYGYGNLKFLQATGGVHEPQEEYAFQTILKALPSKAIMLELGSYWSFYSLWFHQVVEEPKCYLIEPILSNLNYGKKNFSINNFSGDFIQAYVGNSTAPIEGVQQVRIDNFLEEKGISKLHILHSDIQGAELDMLKGAVQYLQRRQIDYLFISTHSNHLHAECQKFLTEVDYSILASADLDDAFSPDGIIVAKRKELLGVGPIPISLKSKLGKTYKVTPLEANKET